MKICHNCQEEKLKSEFNKNKAKKDGLGSTCRVCMKIFRKRHYDANKVNIVSDVKKHRRTKRNWFVKLREGLVCTRCGESHPATLDFHHIDPSNKEFTISHGVRSCFSGDRILKEMEKCIVICSNCHRRLHWDENIMPQKHLTG